MADIYDVVIIGGGPAGLAAALYASRGLHSTLIVEKGMVGGQITHTERVEDYPGIPDGIGGAELGKAMWDQVTRFGTKTITAEALSIEAQGELKTVRTTEGEMQARTVVLACGSVRNDLGVPGERELAGKGVGAYALYDAAKFQGQQVVVVGGGDTALSEALALSKSASKVTIVHRRDRFRAIAALQEQVEAAENIEVQWNTVVEAISGTEKVTGVALQDTATGEKSELATAGVFVHIGYRPNTEWFAQLLAPQPDGRIATDEWMTTSLPGVFVAGDVRANTVQQVISAAGDGATAAIAADHYLNGAE